jgi:hypothetical protein
VYSENAQIPKIETDAAIKNFQDSIKREGDKMLSIEINYFSNYH